MPLPVLPPTRRHLVAQIRRRLDLGLAPIVVVRGPRQIGKTTAHLQLVGDLLSEGIEPRRILHLQFDELRTLESFEEPVLRLVEWYEREVLGESLNEAAHAGKPALLFFDEVQNLDRWAPQLKFLVDTSTVRVLVTGSSALRIEHGRDSLAGRITTIEAGVLSLTEVGAVRGIAAHAPFLGDNGLDALVRQEFWEELLAHGTQHQGFRDEAFQALAQRGGYPLAHKVRDAPWPMVADQLNETVIRRVIQHDLRVGQRGRKRDAALLEEIFRLACRYAGQSPSVALLAGEAQRALHANVGAQRARSYLSFLADTLLLRLIPPLEIRLKRQRGAPKICLVDHGLRASWLQEAVPLDPRGLEAQPELASLAGHLAESTVGATLATIGGLDVSHQPERGADPEVDFVLTIGVRRIPLEVKYQGRIDPLNDTVGLRAFLEKRANNAPFGLLVTRGEGAGLRDQRIVAIPLPTLMLLR
jgi:predicted AAA+ superfamily ATPase